MARVNFNTYGCSNNFAETEIMSGLLKKEGYEIVKTPEEANLIIFNACTVKGNTSVTRDIKRITQNNPDKKVIITGCITPDLIPDIKKIKKDISLLSTRNINQIAEVADNTLKGHVVESLEKNNHPKILLPKVRKNDIISIVPICSGCNSFCSYCSTKLVKGDTFSYPIKDIRREVENSIKDGCKEIWLTGQDTACYGKDINANLAQLLEELVKIDGDFKIRVGMMNPRNALLFADNLVKVMSDEKIFKFLHIPLQCANDRILSKMLRGHTYNQYAEFLDKFKKNIPDMTIATDIIVGFPTETEDEFKDTLNSIKKLDFDIVNISKFQPRPGTLAAKMPQLKREIINERSKRLTDEFRANSKDINNKWIGWQGKVLIDEKGKDGKMIGRNYAYKLVEVPYGNIGDIIDVKIISADTFHLVGEKISKESNN